MIPRLVRGGGKGIAARSIAVAALVAGGTLAVTAAPAQAYPTCWRVTDISYSSGHIYAWADYLCPYYPEKEGPAPVSIQRQDPATGTWTTLVSGTGGISYTCVGTSTHTFRTGSTGRDSSVTAACY